MIKEITDNQLPKFNTDEQAIIEFGAEWCPPCKIQHPILEEIANDDKLKTKVFTIDVDDNSKITEELGIMSIPTIFIIKEGKLANRIVGYQPYDQLTSYLK